ncbi:MAG: oligosaccharide flippase family protein [Elusimicrobiota bacterium]
MLGDLKTLGKDTLVYGLSTVAARLLNFLLLPFYTHFLAPGEYGIVAIVFTYIAFANAVFQYGMDQAYLRFAANQPPAKTDACFSTAQWSLLASAAAFAALLILGAAPVARLTALRPGDAALIRYAALILALDAITIVPFAELRLRRRKWAFVGIKFFHIVINVLGNIFFLGVLKMGVEGVLIAALFASSASLVLLAPVCALRLRACFDFKLYRELLRFGLPFIPAGIGAMMVQVIDRPILQHLTDEATVGIYQANYRLGIFMMLIVTMFDQAWRPFFLEKAKDEDAKPVFARVLTYFLTASVLIVAALSLFIGDIVRLPLGGVSLIHPAYWSGLPVVPVVLAAYILHGAYINFMTSVTLTKRTELLIWVTFLGAAVNIAANFLLIPLLGMMGAAWATFASYTAMALCLYLIGRRIYPIPYEYARLFHLLVITAVMLAAVCAARGAFAGTNAAAWFAARLGALALLPALLLATGFFTAAERRALASLPRRLLRLV